MISPNDKRHERNAMHKSHAMHRSDRMHPIGEALKKLTGVDLPARTISRWPTRKKGPKLVATKIGCRWFCTESAMREFLARCNNQAGVTK
jgi:hypothetical protein